MNLLLRAVIAAVLLSVGGANLAWSQDKQAVTLAIDKMFCPLCGNAVKKALNRVPGVEDVQVDMDRKVATVRYDGTRATVDDLTRATAKAGFPATLRRSGP